MSAENFFTSHTTCARVPLGSLRNRAVAAKFRKHVERAVADAGFVPVNLGAIPTPALKAYAISTRCGSIMVTGSHIPLERNGYKTNSATGELKKEDEAPITQLVAQLRERILATPRHAMIRHSALMTL